ncbi:hypothetical protein [Microbacterium sp. 77mftsu3.1]|uniref:hypothetical protein n=1 Tax=Microbacterium sp. 77mftsu3.1 TaxID=1761802 RepID=UPI00037FAEAB|nr:hypothetical protein [Microbacterium sp. 77mftsu3.1]SDH34528.1 hypothetical protein SAMN04488590_3087 [Microbacterium sp. 77mftsu3.1]
MSSPIKVTDLVARSLSELDQAGRANPLAAERHDANAAIFSRLAQAQSMKTANVIAYLNSDRSKWSEEDEHVVRAMLGLPSMAGDEEDEDDGGLATEDQPAPDPTPASFPDVTPVQPTVEPDLDDMPDFDAPATRQPQEVHDFA